MHFAVVVENAFVAEDLSDILQVSFADAQVSFYTSLAALEAGRRHVAPAVLVASMPVDVLRGSPVIREVADGGTAVVVVDNWEGQRAETPEDWELVQSPFTQDSIITAVRAALDRRA